MRYTVRECNGELEIVMQTSIYVESKKYKRRLKKLFKDLDKMSR